jgi:hypothetical protein
LTVLPNPEQVTPHAYLTAQVGRELYQKGSPEDLRLALVVLDGLAEILLRFNVAVQEMWLESGAAAVRLNADAQVYEDVPPLPVHKLVFPTSTTRAELPEGTFVHLSTTQRRKLYEFDPNVDLAVFFATLSRADGDAFKSLHHYRNRAYHHNDARESTLRSLVQLQLTILGRLAGAIRPVMMPIWTSSGDLPPTLSAVARVLDSGIELQPAELAEAFRAALHGQLQVLEVRVGEIVAFLNSVFPIVTFEDVIRLVQLPEPWPGLDEARRATVSVAPEQLEKWRAAIQDISGYGDELQSVVDYFRIEKPLTRLMEDVLLIANQVDRAPWGERVRCPG